jgi:hypothetical protein
MEADLVDRDDDSAVALHPVPSTSVSGSGFVFGSDPDPADSDSVAIVDEERSAGSGRTGSSRALLPSCDRGAATPRRRSRESSRAHRAPRDERCAPRVAWTKTDRPLELFDARTSVRASDFANLGCGFRKSDRDESVDGRDSGRRRSESRSRSDESRERLRSEFAVCDESSLRLESRDRFREVDRRRVKIAKRRGEVVGRPEDSGLRRVVTDSCVGHRSSGGYFFEEEFRRRTTGFDSEAGVVDGGASGVDAATARTGGEEVSGGKIASTVFARSLAAFTSEDDSSKESETRTAGRPANRTTRVERSTEKRAEPS